MIIHVFPHLNEISEPHLEFYKEILHWGFVCSMLVYEMSESHGQGQQWNLKGDGLDRWLSRSGLHCHGEKPGAILSNQSSSKQESGCYGSIRANPGCCNMPDFQETDWCTVCTIFYFPEGGGENYLWIWGCHLALNIFSSVHLLAPTKILWNILWILAYPPWKLLIFLSSSLHTEEQETTIYIEPTNFYLLLCI